MTACLVLWQPQKLNLRTGSVCARQRWYTTETIVILDLEQTRNEAKISIGNWTIKNYPVQFFSRAAFVSKITYNTYKKKKKKLKSPVRESQNSNTSRFLRPTIPERRQITFCWISKKIWLRLTCGLKNSFYTYSALPIGMLCLSFLRRNEYWTNLKPEISSKTVGIPWVLVLQGVLWPSLSVATEQLLSCRIASHWKLCVGQSRYLRAKTGLW